MKLLPEVSKGMERKYYRCSDCGQYQAHDFIPYGLGTQDIQYNPCLCQLTGHNAHLLKEVSPEEFYGKGDLK